jgi:hypothetical protein
METGCEENVAELLAILRGTTNEKPQSPSTQHIHADEVEYVAPKAEDVLKEDAFAAANPSTPTKPSEENQGLCAKFSSNQWKERDSGYVEVIGLLSDANTRNDMVNNTDLVACLAEIVDDSNVSAMDSALELVTIWSVVSHYHALTKFYSFFCLALS